MPWCERCGREVEENELVPPAPGLPAEAPGAAAADGSEAAKGRDRCPSCGSVLGDEAGSDDEDAHPKAPWHFKLLVLGSVGYLGYRLYQGIGWLIHHA
ncbi:MAG: hypothetical protein ACLP36_02840 [Acidimicrobiales bacterium]|jgi:hypothetical protein